MTDPWFYDRPDLVEPLDVGEYEKVVPTPDGWVEHRALAWRSLAPGSVSLPDQGWKIHVSATPNNAERILTVVASRCVQTGTAFKHVPSRRMFLQCNAKHADRAHSGKFVTIYPRDDQELASLLDDLTPQLSGEQSPRVLSDLRIDDGPLHVRYGGFRAMWVDQDGQSVPAVRRPDGVLVADRRLPCFIVPDWVEIPACLAAYEEATRATEDDGPPFSISSAVHFSNSGGIYRATLAPGIADHLGHDVILKEARPHAGRDGAGRDAVDRLRHEHAVLTRLAGLPGIPQAGDIVTVGDHRFLPQQTMPGITLSAWMSRHHPLTTADPDPAAVAAYTERATAVVERVAATVAAIHDRGIAIGDLNPSNVLVDDDDQVSVIDFEVAGEIDEIPAHGLAAPGFQAPDRFDGRAADRYVLAVLRLWMFHPTEAILAMSRAPLPGWIDYVARRFPVPDGWADQLRRDVGPFDTATGPSSGIGTTTRRPDLISDLVAGIRASATPERRDRLFPGDIRQFELDGLCFGHGATGVLHALRVTGADPSPDHESWLFDALEHYSPHRAGLWEGAPGVAYALDGLGHPDTARDLLATHLEQHRMARTDDDLGVRSGLAGTALVTLDLADHRADDRLRGCGLDLADRLTRAPDDPTGLPVAGFLDGWAGPALVFVAAFEQTGDPAWLEHADRALRRDLDRCQHTAHGDLQATDPDHPRTLPYLARGSAGVAVAALALHAHEPDRPSLTTLPALLDACRSEFTAFSGLGLGAAGLVLALAGAPRTPATDTAVARLTELVDRHTVPYGDGRIVAGHQLLRLATDVDTGNAGILLALTAHIGRTPVLPLPGRPRPPAATDFDTRRRTHEKGIT